MRKILFKGKRTDSGEWVYGDFRNTNGMNPHNAFIVTYTNEQYNEVIPETVGQYTNLKDICNKDIFEGDIMRTAVTGLTQHVGVVEFSDGSFGLRCTDGGAYFLCFVSGSYTIIGNIHDNPELLNK